MESITTEVSLLDEEAYSTASLETSQSFRLIPRIKTDEKMRIINFSNEPYQPSYDIESRGGILNAVGAWSDYEDIDSFIDEVYDMREKSIDRPVDL